MRLTANQLAALRTVQRVYTNKWRQHIEFIWSTGMWPSCFTADEKAALQQLRNTLGPVWLAKYRPGDVQVGWLADAHYEDPTRNYAWKRGYRIAHADGKDMIQPYVSNKTEARQLARDLQITLIEDML